MPDTRSSPSDRTYRLEVDWGRLLREGMRVRLGPPLPVGEATLLVAPVSKQQDVIVLMIPVPHGRTERIRDQLLEFWVMARSLGKFVKLAGFQLPKGLFGGG